jgi:biopolymer transport protein ExbD
MPAAGRRAANDLAATPFVDALLLLLLLLMLLWYVS